MTRRPADPVLHNMVIAMHVSDNELPDPLIRFAGSIVTLFLCACGWWQRTHGKGNLVVWLVFFPDLGHGTRESDTDNRNRDMSPENCEESVLRN
jgi:hypothetical protein